MTLPDSWALHQLTFSRYIVGKKLELEHLVAICKSIIALELVAVTGMSSRLPVP